MVGLPDGARIVLATQNPGKLREFRALLQDQEEIAQWFNSTQQDPQTAVIDAASAGCADVPETGVTFAANALLKARAIAEATGLPAVSDDSGLSVDVLGGAPGIFSARWGGAQASDEFNRQLLLQQLADIAPEHRGAAFVCAAALVVPTPTGVAEEYVAHGKLEGALLPEEKGDGGFGYDPILQPVGETRSCAQLSMDEKNAISHRGRAFAQLVPQLVQVLTR